jgi:hypothetical protein
MFLSCNGGEGDIIRGIGLYKQGKPAEALPLLERGIMESAAVKSFSRPFPRQAGGALIAKSGNRYATVFPVRLSIKIPGEPETAAYNHGEEILAVTAASKLYIIGRNGRVKNEIALPRDAGEAALSWSADHLLCYTGGRLYRAGTGKGAGLTPISSENLPPPFKGSHYRAAVYSQDGRTAVAAGIAGMYAIWAVDDRRGEVLFRGVAASSPEILIRGDSLFFISGSSGSWKLSFIAMNGRSRNELAAFPRLSGLGFFSAGMIFDTGDGFGVYEYSGAWTTAPLHFTYRGSCGSYALLEYNDRLYAVDADAVIGKLLAIKKELPGLFSGGVALMK